MGRSENAAPPTNKPEPNREEIENQLKLIAESPQFDATARTQQFLRFIVGQVLEQQSKEISQYAIATRVFGRDERFDPTTDPIVRIQAGRLRRSLEHYYLTSGALDPVRISVPKGAYVPKFRYQKSDKSTGTGKAPFDAFDKAYKEAGTWPAVLISPFQNLGEDPQHDYLGQGLATELGIELDRYGIVRVFIQPQTAEEVVPSGTDDAGSVIRFRIEGTIETRVDSLSILVRLLDTSNGLQIWGRKYRCQLDDPELSSFLDEVSMSVAAVLADERGIIIRHLLCKQLSGPPAHADSHDAILRFYHFQANPSPDSFSTVLAALRKALDVDPEHGLLWSLLARMYAMNHSLEMLPLDTPINDAYDYARNGVHLEPDNQRAHGVLAFVHLVRDELEDGRREAEAALNINPNSFCFIDALGYLLTLLGDWDRGIALTDKAMRLNPFHQKLIHFARWLNHLRLGEDKQAYQQALAAGDSGGFWAPLTRASSLAHLGRLDEARCEAAQLLVLKPDFTEHWHRLVTRYMKFDELVQRTAHGLRKAGLELNDS